MRLTANATAAVLGGTALVLLVFAPGPLPIVALIVALARLGERSVAIGEHSSLARRSGQVAVPMDPRSDERPE